MPEAKRAGIAARLGSIKDFVWWQLYTGEVLPALKNKPTASLKKEAKFEYGWYTRTRLNKTAEETGVDFKTVYCLFDYADANISLLESKVLGIDRSVIRPPPNAATLVFRTGTHHLIFMLGPLGHQVVAQRQGPRVQR